MVYNCPYLGRSLFLFPSTGCCCRFLVLSLWDAVCVPDFPSEWLEGVCDYLFSLASLSACLRSFLSVVVLSTVVFLCLQLFYLIQRRLNKHPGTLKRDSGRWGDPRGCNQCESWHFPAATRDSHVSLRPWVPTWPCDSPHTLASCSSPPHLPAVVMWLAKWPTWIWMFGLVLSPVGGQVALGDEIQSSVLVPVGPSCPFVLAVKSPLWLFWTQT